MQKDVGQLGDKSGRERAGEEMSLKIKIHVQNASSFVRKFQERRCLPNVQRDFTWLFCQPVLPPVTCFHLVWLYSQQPFFVKVCVGGILHIFLAFYLGLEGSPGGSFSKSRPLSQLEHA